MIVTHKLSPMDLTCRGVTQRIDVVQDDRYSRNLEFTLTQNGEAWPIPEGAAAVIRFQKSDGTGGNYDTLPDGSLAYSFSGNVLTVALAPQVCTVPGLVLLAVGLLYGDAEINTFTVHIVVQPNPGIDAASEDYTNMRSYIKSFGWPANMYLCADENGNVSARSADIGNALMLRVNDLDREMDTLLPKSGGTMTGAINMNGQNISGLNPPTEQSQAANKGYVDASVRKAAPRNLLDNSDFRNPVNQRGNASCGTNGYWIDRWIHAYVAYTDIKEGCIGINATGNTIGGLSQVIADAASYDGKRLTLAVCAKSNGGGMRLSFPYVSEIPNVQLSDDWAVYIFTVTFSTNSHNTIGIYAEAGSTIDIKWAALYEGEYTAETLPEYQSKGYGAELAECRRYYRRSYAVVGNGNSGYWSINFDIPMRVTPTVTITSNGTASLYESSKDYISVQNVTGVLEQILYEASADL